MSYAMPLLRFLDADFDDFRYADDERCLRHAACFFRHAAHVYV